MSALVVHLAHGSAFGSAVDMAATPFPASFDNNPLVFAWALFARMLVASLSLATIVRIVSRNRSENIPANHPVFYHRAMVSCFLWAFVFGAGSDCITYLAWNEVTIGTMSMLLLFAKMLDGITMVPFLLALFVPLWLSWLQRIGMVHVAPSITLNGLVNDVRVTWEKRDIPLKLTYYCAAGSAGVTLFKYLLWLEHVRS